jgi:hypothetical protein
MTKALQATEIIKTRLSFLHQENKLISHTVQLKKEEGDDNPSETRIRSGISITLSRNQFAEVNAVGYQKPKPRQFLQPPPNQTQKWVKKTEEKDVEPEEDLRKPKNFKERAKTIRPRRSSLDEDLDRKKSVPKKYG